MKTKHIVLAGLACVIVFALISYSPGGSKGGTQDIQKLADEMEGLKKEVEVLKNDLNTFKLNNNPPVPNVEGTAGEGLKVATISVRRVFQECRRGAGYRQQAIAEQGKIVAELDKLSKEIETERAGLATLKEGSTDYILGTKELFGKQANYQALKEFYTQQMEYKDQLWTKELYQDILLAAREVARNKGFDLVFREDEVDFSETDIAELGMAMRSQKLFYSGGCVDISDEVIARLDAKE